MTLHATNDFNVIATLNQHLQTQLAAITRPSWLPSYTVYVNEPEAIAQYPAFSFVHTTESLEDAYGGRVVGAGEVGGKIYAHISTSIWVNRGNSAWLAQQRTMIAMLKDVYLTTTTVTIQNYLSDPSNPSSTSYKVDLTGLEQLAVAPDPNPDVMRSRFVIFYCWTQRH